VALASVSDDVAQVADSDQRLLLRRGSQRLVVFQGCPVSSTTRSLRRAGAKIGLALSSDELRTMTRIDIYDYGFISLRAHSASALDSAITDLARNNWTRQRHDPPQIEDGPGARSQGTNAEPMRNGCVASPVPLTPRNNKTSEL